MTSDISLGSANSRSISGHITPADAIADIQSGKFKNQIDALRAATGDERDRLKKLLPAILWAGKFTTRKNEGIEKFSGLLCADVDKVAERIGELHDIARNDPHAAAAFVSPSGTGIKIVFCVPVAADAKQHRQNFAAVRAHVDKLYKAQVDEAAKDVARLCFVSHDPAAFFNADAVPLAVPSDPAAVANVPPRNGAGQANGTSTRTEVAERILGAIRWTDEGGFCQCPGQHLHTTPNGDRDCKVMLDGAPSIKCFHGSCAGIVEGVNHELRSRIGKAERPTAPSPSRASSAAEYLGDDGHPQPSLIERLEARIYSPLVEPKEPAPRFLLAGMPICTPGNLTAISAQAKAGKSAVIGAMIGSTFATSGVDCLGFTSKNPHGYAVLHIDTEQCLFDHWAGIQRAIRRAMLATPPNWLRSYCLTGFSADDVRGSIRILIEQNANKFGGIHSVLIDGSADAVPDVNDPAETGSFVTELHGLAIKFYCPILNIIHVNPGSDFKTRGHLGSQLERKSETNLRLEKDDAGATVIWADKNRRAPIPKGTAPRFAWNDEAGMHTTIASLRSSKDEAEKQALQIEAEAVFTAAGNAVISYGQFISFLEREVQASKSTAKRHFSQMLRTKIICKEPTGLYALTHK